MAEPLKDKANEGDKEAISNHEPDKSFFSKSIITSLSLNTPQRVKRTNLALQAIKDDPGITSYRLAKNLDVSYTDICRIVRDLEYCGLIQIKIVLKDNNRINKQLFSQEVLSNGE